MKHLVRHHDWSMTPLGPIVTWPVSLRLAVELVMDSPLAMILLWGGELIQIYNDGYRELMAGKHPAGLGLATRDCWPEVWSFAAPVYEAVLRGEGRSFRSQKLVLDRGGPPGAGWFDLTYMPVRDESGGVAGILATVVEVTAEVLRDRRRRFLGELEERLRALRDADEVMAAACEALGRELGAGLVAYADIDAAGGTATIGRDWTDGSMPSITGRHRLRDFGAPVIDDLERARAVVIDDVRTDLRTAAAGVHRAFDDLSVRALLDVPLVKDGRLLAVLTILARQPRTWADGDIELAQGTAERTWAAVERSRAEAALRKSEALLDAIFESAPLGLGVWDKDLRFVRVNRRLAEMNGIAPEHHVGRHPAELLPDLRDLGSLLEGWRRVLETGVPMVGVEVTGATPAEPDALRHWTEHFFPIRVGPAILGLGGIVEDTTARRQADEHRTLLTDELNHRVKNTLAIVQAIARQTFRRGDVPGALREAFEGRLAALAAAHDLLTGSNWQSAALDDLVRDVLGSCGSATCRATIRGPRVVLQPREAVGMALALHELCTNAMKYGAMSADRGAVDVSWTLVEVTPTGVTPTGATPTGATPAGETPLRLELVWRESGGPPVLPPQRLGFGSRMIEQVLAQELRGEVRLAFAPDGLVCTITAPRPTGGGRS